MISSGFTAKVLPVTLRLAGTLAFLAAGFKGRIGIDTKKIVTMHKLIHNYEFLR